jgi:DNA-packaging protein gp3
MAVMGRPTKYDAKYCGELLRFFNKRVVRERTETVEGKNWSKDTLVREAIFFPSFEGFAAKIGVATDTLYEWAKKHKDFSDAMLRARAKQHSLIYEHGMTGYLNPRLAGLFAQSNMGMHERILDEGEKTITIKHQDMARD